MSGRRRIRRGFTLVELLVVVVIISMLVGLLIPAVQSARARARQTQCINNQRQIGLAVLQYEGAKKHFPGYVNKIGTGAATTTTMPLSWTTVILPYMDNEAAWREWRELRVGDNFAPLVVRVPAYVCPSDTLGVGEIVATDDSADDSIDRLAVTVKADLSYAANCGRADYAVDPVDSAACGIFHNRFDGSMTNVSASSIPDGASQTILLSENLQAGFWFIDPDRPAPLWEFDLGINWVTVPGQTSDKPAQPPTDMASVINGCSEGCTGHAAPGTRPRLAAFARPSSSHPGGVVAAFCDGSVKFLSERIFYLTYQHLMAPDSRTMVLANEFVDQTVPDPEWQE